MLQVTALHSRLRSRVTAGAAPENIGPDDELPLVDEAEHDHEISQWMNPADYRRYLEDVRAVAVAKFCAQSESDCEAGCLCCPGSALLATREHCFLADPNKLYMLLIAEKRRSSAAQAPTQELARAQSTP